MCALYWSLLCPPYLSALVWAAFWDTAWAGTQSNPHAPMPLRLLPKAPVLHFKPHKRLHSANSVGLLPPQKSGGVVLPLHRE